MRHFWTNRPLQAYDRSLQSVSEEILAITFNMFDYELDSIRFI